MTPAKLVKHTWTFGAKYLFQTRMGCPGPRRICETREPLQTVSNCELIA